MKSLCLVQIKGRLSVVDGQKRMEDYQSQMDSKEYKYTIFIILIFREINKVKHSYNEVPGTADFASL